MKKLLLVSLLSLISISSYAGSITCKLGSNAKPNLMSKTVDIELLRQVSSDDMSFEYAGVKYLLSVLDIYPTGDIASKKEVMILNQVKDNKITSVISDGSLLYHSDMEKMISFNCEKK